MTGFLLFLGFVAGLVIGYSVITRRAKPKFLATAEYWVYLPGDSMPPQDRVMDRMLAGNPHSKRGQSPIGKNEGLVFSDVRLHIALVLRKRNPHVFRPDLFEDHIEPSATDLQALSEAQSLVKVRYVSEEPLPDKRHLQFLLHAADAYAALGEGRIVYDVMAERLIPIEELQATLTENFDATGPELHVRTVWKRTATGGVAQTRGLAKIGFHELATSEMEADERWLVKTVLDEAVKEIWQAPSMPASVEVSAYDDRFRILVQEAKDRLATVRIQRVQAT